jgi:hypothetical protein
MVENATSYKTYYAISQIRAACTNSARGPGVSMRGIVPQGTVWEKRISEVQKEPFSFAILESGVIGQIQLLPRVRGAAPRSLLARACPKQPKQLGLYRNFITPDPGCPTPLNMAAANGLPSGKRLLQQ